MMLDHEEMLSLSLKSTSTISGCCENGKIVSVKSKLTKIAFVVLLQLKNNVSKCESREAHILKAVRMEKRMYQKAKQTNSLSKCC